MRRKAKKSKLFLILILVLGISVGYAALSKTLKINGNSIVKGGSWNIHWDRVNVKDGSVTGTNVVKEATITDTKKTIVEYSVILPEPGDYYEFTVDAVNEGTIDAMVDYVANSGLTAEQKKYIEYSVTYQDGGEVRLKDKLSAGASERMIVKVKYRNDDQVNPSDLPQTDPEPLDLKFEVTYVQATDEAAIRDGVCNELIYENGPISEGTYLNLCRNYIDENLYTYVDNGDGTITITGFKNVTFTFKENTWALPTEIDGKKVTKISGDAFDNKGISATLILNPLITTIENGTLTGSQGAFSNNNISLVALPQSLISIGNSAFSGDKVEKISIKSNTTTIGEAAFLNNKIKDLVIPDTVTVLSGGSFFNNPLETLKIGNGVESINSSISPGLTTLKKLDLNTKKVNSGWFMNATNLKDVILRENVEIIEYNTFYGSGVTNLTLSEGLKEIGSAAFHTTPSLVSINLPSTIETIDSGAFLDSGLTGTITLPKELTTLGTSAFCNCNIDKVIFNKKLTLIDYATFLNNNISEITIPANIESLGRGAFVGNVINKLNLNEGLLTIDSECFSGNKLNIVTIPSTVTSIGNSAFYKTDTSNSTLTKINNKTNNSFKWNKIINNDDNEESFVTGTVINSNGNVQITSE